MSRLLIGTSGWNYPKGRGTWNGIFYPAPGSRPRGAGRFDELAFYAEHFDTVEVNSTFYRLPAPAAVRSWVERTPKTFEFSLKLFQKFTHPALFQKAGGPDVSPIGQPDVDAFRAAIDPIVSAGRMGALLAQFPSSFRNDPESRAHLEWVLDVFHEFDVAVELRHRSWSDAQAGTVALLDAAGAAWVQIDEPKFRDSIRQPLTPNGSALFYLRLHGRNAAQWWTHENAEDRYNYHYSEAELAPLAKAAGEASRVVRKSYVYANNHFSAKAVANAAILKHQIGQPLPGEYPEEFVETYPELQGLVRLLPPRLIRGPKPS